MSIRSSSALRLSLIHILNEMAARVERNVAELRETARRKQQLVDNVAHELRTPLTAVGGYAEYIQRAELSEEEKYEAAQYIVEEDVYKRQALAPAHAKRLAALCGPASVFCTKTLALFCVFMIE